MGGEDLQGAELGDAILDVIERELEDVDLALPQGGPLGLEAGPVDGGEEAAVEGEPGVVAGGRVAAVLRVGVEPVLEGVDAGDVGQEHDGLYEAAGGIARRRSPGG